MRKTKLQYQKTPIYHRVLLKISGEALRGEQQSDSIHASIVNRIANDIAIVHQSGIQIGIVLGAGNFFRGAVLSRLGIDRITGDQMGMVSTVLNALALREALEKKGLMVIIMSAIPMAGIVEHYDRLKAIHYLQQNQILIFAGGTGNPLVTTDSAASLRSIEIQADVLLKATNVDGIYAEDPRKNPKAKFYTHLDYQTVLQQELAVMDLTAFVQCRDHHMPIRIFNIHKKNALYRIITGLKEGTLVSH